MYLKPNYICHTLLKANVRGNSYMTDPEHRLCYPNAASNSMQLHGIYCQFRQRRGRCEGMVRHYVEHPCPSFRINVMAGLPLLRELADVQCSVSFHNFSNELCTQLTFCCIIVARYRNILPIFPRIPSHIKLRIWYNASQQTISKSCAYFYGMCCTLFTKALCLGYVMDYGITCLLMRLIKEMQSTRLDCKAHHTGFPRFTFILCSAISAIFEFW